jgi:hypothetical protein
MHFWRTNRAFTLFIKADTDRKINYYDVTSLYPFINITGKVPYQTYILRLTYKVERDYMFHFWEGFLDFHNIIYLYMYPLLFQDIKGTFPVIFMNGYTDEVTKAVEKDRRY